MRGKKQKKDEGTMSQGRVTRGGMLGVLGVLVAILLASSLLVPVALAGKPVRTPGVPEQGRQWAIPEAPKGLVAVSRPLAAQVGAEMLARGGNAIDAAAATQFALNVEEPMMTGIGGGAFIVWYRCLLQGNGGDRRQDDTAGSG